MSDRILSVRFRERKVNITIIQVYAPTSTALEEQDDFFNKLQSTIDRTPKGDVIMVIGDSNAKVGHHKELTDLTWADTFELSFGSLSADLQEILLDGKKPDL